MELGPLLKKLICVLGIALGSAAASLAAGPAPLTSIRAIQLLSDAEARQQLPVAFEATVTHSGDMLFVQDDGSAVFVVAPPNSTPLLGDRVLVRGKTLGSFRPIVMGESVTLLHHGELPKPIPATFDQLIHVQRDCLLVSLRGMVHAADVRPDRKSATLQLLTDGGYIDAIVNSSDPAALETLLDAEVEVTGVVVGEFDGKMQMHGVFIGVSSPDNVKILRPAAATPWSLPVTPMDGVIAGFHVTDRTERVRVHGIVTYYQPRTAVVLQDGNKSLWISTLAVNPMRVGDVVDATGFPEAHSGFLVLSHGEIQDSHVLAPVDPLPTTEPELEAGKHAIDLVSVEGKVVMAARGASQDEYGLMAEGHMFKAIFRHPPSDTALPPMKPIALGSKVRVTGICILEDSNPFNGPVPFDILMRGFDDIGVIAKPSLMSVRNLVLAVTLLLVVVIAVSAWGWTLRRKVDRQTAKLETMAQFELRRSNILEKINGADPQAEILEEITALVSSTLNGAPCWCEIAGGTPLGVVPALKATLRVVQMRIAGHSGTALGTLSVGLDSSTPHSDHETEALKVGARMASLTIETRRLYTDLRRRSEFDLLTDIPNRFAMEKFMDARIEEARQTAGTMGLIYIDLDKFKAINDEYGHHVGDLFLQEVAGRMKRQLRGGDMLARLGGDEFAAVISVIRNRTEMEGIVKRIKHCFEKPFVVDGYLLQGGASVGVAFYPEDGLNRESLLGVADAAMYLEKKEGKRHEQEVAGAVAEGAPL
jgi:diguanylate cyclase (GGDEF)-like protein